MAAGSSDAMLSDAVWTWSSEKTSSETTTSAASFAVSPRRSEASKAGASDGSESARRRRS